MAYIKLIHDGNPSAIRPATCESSFGTASGCCDLSIPPEPIDGLGPWGPGAVKNSSGHRWSSGKHMGKRYIRNIQDTVLDTYFELF